MLVRNGDRHRLWWSVDPKHSRKVPPGIYSELLQSYGCISMKLCANSLERFEEFKQPKSKFYKRNILSFSKSNSQKRLSLCSFLKQ